MRVVLKAENDRRARGERNERILSTESEKQVEIEGQRGMKDTNTFETIDEARREKGDMYSGFKYTL